MEFEFLFSTCSGIRKAQRNSLLFFASRRIYSKNRCFVSFVLEDEGILLNKATLLRKNVSTQNNIVIFCFETFDSEVFQLRSNVPLQLVRVFPVQSEINYTPYLGSIATLIWIKLIPY